MYVVRCVVANWLRSGPAAVWPVSRLQLFTVEPNGSGSDMARLRPAGCRRSQLARVFQWRGRRRPVSSEVDRQRCDWSIAAVLGWSSIDWTRPTAVDTDSFMAANVRTSFTMYRTYCVPKAFSFWIGHCQTFLKKVWFYFGNLPLV